MMLKSLLLGLLFMTSLFPSAAEAGEDGAAYRERLVCVPLKLTAVDKSEAIGLALDIGKASADIAQNSVARDYEFPGGQARVSFTLRYLPQPARVEVSKLYMKKSGKSWSLMMTFASPQVLEIAGMANVTYVLKAGDTTGPIPEFDTECQLERTRIDQNCANCR